MFTKIHEGVFARQNQNSGTNLPFPSLLTSSIFAEQKREEDPRRSSKQTSQSIESRM